MGQYCAIYPDIKWRPGPAEGAVAANKFIEAYLAKIKPGDIRLTSPFPEGVDLGDAMRQSGRYNEWIGEDKRLRLDYCLSTVEEIPPIWIMQGTEDSRVSLYLGWKLYGNNSFSRRYQRSPPIRW